MPIRATQDARTHELTEKDRGMQTSRRLLVLTIASTVAVSSPAFAQDRIEHPGAGIAIDRPAGWQEATLAQVQANREHARLTDPELQHALTTRSAMPLLVFTKYQDGHAGLNPTIQVTLRPALAGNPAQLLASAIQIMRRGFEDFQVVTPPRSTKVDGWAAAQARATYTLRTDRGETFDVDSRFWLIPRGRLMFLVGMSGSQVGEDACETEFTDALSSLTIQP
jgi:hypothetical protein